jgi:hypothetical protein
MTPTITTPTSRDPRFPKPQPQTPGDRVRAQADAKTLRCDREGCPTKLHVPVELTSDQRSANASAHGFVRGEGDKAHKFYCGKTCRAMDAIRMELPSKSTCQRCKKAILEGRQNGCICRPQIGGGPPQCPITRVSVRDVTDRQHVLHRAIVCDRWACRQAHYIDAKMGPDRIAQFAFDHGFVQTPHGTCCGHDCARHIARDVAAGRQDPIDLSVEVINTARTAAGLATIEPGREGVAGTTDATQPAPEATTAEAAPAHAAQAEAAATDEWGVWCIERRAWVPSTANPWKGDEAGAKLRLAHIQRSAEIGYSFAARAFADPTPPPEPITRKSRRAAEAHRGA